MKLSKNKLITLIIAAGVLVFLPFAGRYLLDNHQTPNQQLDKLGERTNSETARIFQSSLYTIQITERRCLNQGKGEFFAIGRDTVWCTYTAAAHSDLSGKELRKLIESAGWERELYDDGSGSDFRRKDASICFVYDGNTYHSRKEAEETYVNGVFYINCQSYTYHYNSSLPAPKYSED
jgi:hypothetical protein